MSFLNTLATSTSASAKISAAAAVTPVSLKDDVQVVDPPGDSVSGLAFSPTADLLAVGSWDSSVSGSPDSHTLMLMRTLLQVRVYQVAPNGQTQGRATYTHTAPVLSVAWSKVRAKRRPILSILLITRRMGASYSLAGVTVQGEC